MTKIESINDLWPDYPNTYALIKALDCDSYTFHENDKVIGINFSSPKGSLLLTVDELAQMDRPSFITPYQMDRMRYTRDDVLAAIKSEFGKEVITKAPPHNTSRADKNKS